MHNPVVLTSVIILFYLFPSFWELLKFKFFFFDNWGLWLKNHLVKRAILTPQSLTTWHMTQVPWVLMSPLWNVSLLLQKQRFCVTTMLLFLKWLMDVNLKFCCNYSLLPCPVICSTFSSGRAEDDSRCLVNITQGMVLWLCQFTVIFLLMTLSLMSLRRQTVIWTAPPIPRTDKKNSA